MEERLGTTNRRGRPLGVFVVATAAAVVASASAAEGAELLRHGNGSDSGSTKKLGSDKRLSLRRRHLETDGEDEHPEGQNPAQPMLSMPMMEAIDDGAIATLPPPVVEDRVDPTSTMQPPHTDPVGEFSDPALCVDDPNFGFELGDSTLTCGEVSMNRRAAVICREEVQPGVMVGTVYCPQTCNMVEQCMELMEDWGLASDVGAGVDTGATASVTDANVTTAPPRAEYWYPTEAASDYHPVVCVHDANYPDDYLHPAIKHIILFETEDACCAQYNKCQPLLTTPPTTTAAARGERWYPKLVEGRPSCVLGADYPNEYAENAEFALSFLFDDQLGCCEAFPSACAHFAWYPDEANGVCVYGEDYTVMSETHFFMTEAECCDVWCGGAATETTSTTAVVSTVASTTAPNATAPAASTAASTVAATSAGTVASTVTSSSTVASTSTTTETTAFTTTTTTATTTTGTTSPETTTTTAMETSSPASTTTTTTTTTGATSPASTTTPDPCTDCVWHESITEYATCTNSLTYPPTWDQYPAARAYFFFHTPEECCETRFPNSCAIVDVSTEEINAGENATEFIALGPRTIEDFDGDAAGLPFDFGEPDMWVYDSEMVRSGMRSVTNVPAYGPGDSSDLTLKFSVAGPAQMRCYASIDVSMPYEMFYLELDGNRMNQYYEPLGDGWHEIVFGFGPGEHTAVFRVENAAFDHGLPERAEHFGTGRVWLDDCEVNYF